MFLRRIGIFSIALVIAHGCVTVPQHDLADKMSSSGLAKVGDLAVESGFFAQGVWPKETWWQDFDDPILTSLVEQGLKLSPTLQRAESRLKAASQVALQKRARLYPEIDFVADDNWQHLSKHGLYRQFASVFPAIINQIDLGFSLFYEFDFWGKNRDLFKAALGQAAAMAAEKKQAELILTTSIAYTYLEVQYYLRRLSLLEQIQMNTKAILALTAKRQADALDTEQRKLLASTMTLDIDAEIYETEQSLRVELHKLKALTGLGQDAIIDLEYSPLKNVEVGVPPNLSLDLLARRPDLTAQLMRLEAAAKEIDAAKTDFYPNFNLSAMIGFESLKNRQILSLSSYQANLAPALHLPLFTAGRLKAQLYEKVANFNEAVYSYNELILKAAQDVTDSLTNIALLWKQIETRRETVDNNRKTAKLYSDRFLAALDDKIVVLDAENVYLESELDLAQLEYGRQLAKVQLIKALGGGYNQ